METLGMALLADEIPAPRAITAIISREEIAGALRNSEGSPELYLDLDRRGEDGSDERSTIGITWSHDELEKVLERVSGDDIVLTFDRGELQSAFDDVEAHGLRQRALVFAVAAAGAIGSGATIANAAPIMGPDSGGVTSAAAVQELAAESIATAGGAVSNVHTPGLQTGDEGSTTAAQSVRASVSTGTAPASDAGLASNLHSPGLQLGPEGSTAATPSVHVSGSSSSGEFLGVPSRDLTDGLIAGGLLLAIAGATFAGGRRTSTPRPA
jgi:hypothetical protein